MGVCVGVDVAKTHLDWVVGPDGEVQRIENSPAAVRRLVRRLRKLDFDRVVLESTGQYERLLFEALEDERIPVCRINPFRVRRFGEGMGVLAKNDSIDARPFALFGEKVEPEERPTKTDRERLLGDLSARRRQLIANMAAEKNRLEHASGYVAKEIKSLIRIFERHIEKLETKIDQLIAEDERQRKDFVRLQSVPGVGPKVAHSLIVDLPELGKLDRRRISSLVGLPPYANDSGQKQGKRSIHGSRSAPRTTLSCGDGGIPVQPRAHSHEAASPGSGQASEGHPDRDRPKATDDPQCDRQRLVGVEAKARIEKVDNTVAF